MLGSYAISFLQAEVLKKCEEYGLNLVQEST